jgi:hypothetical protein
MRKGWRKLLAMLGMVLFGTIVDAAPPEPPGGGGKVVRIAVEVSWAVRGGGADGVMALELTEGRVVEALSWPDGVRRQRHPEPLAAGGLDLGPAPTGQVRALIEAPLGASLRLQGEGQATLIPILALIEGPQRTPPQTPVEIAVERLPWDAVLLDAGPGDGTVAPGGTVPVAVGYNILTPEPTQVAVRCAARLRPVGGTETLWQDERHEAVTTNHPLPAAQVFSVPAPAVEGTYVLELETSWEPVPSPESSRLGRWIRRRRNPLAVTSATRRLTLTVLNPRAAAAVPTASGPGPHDHDVEVVDLTRMRGYRPVASGRSPLPAGERASWPVPGAALVEPSGRDRLRGWITGWGAEAANLAPADANGLAWTALGLKVAHPGRPHRLTLTVGGGHPAALGVALIAAPGLGSGSSPGQGGPPRVVLDACASGPPVVEGAPPASFSWLVWPDDPDPVVVMVNRDPNVPVQIGTVTLTELADVPPGPPLAGPTRPSGAPWDSTWATPTPSPVSASASVARTGPDPPTRWRRPGTWRSTC